MKTTIEIILTTDQVKLRPVNQWLESILKSRDFDYEVFCVADGVRAVVHHTLDDLGLEVHVDDLAAMLPKQQCENCGSWVDDGQLAHNEETGITECDSCFA